jgi:hypothetical protein
VPVATFVISTDEDENWRPTEYQAELLGTEVRFRFSMVMLTDYWARWEELERSDNPFAVVAQAHLIAPRTRDDARGRLEKKLEITKHIYERGFSEQQIIGLFRFLDWVLALPGELESEFRREMDRYEEERKMRYVTSVERVAMAEMLLRQLQKRFGALDEATQRHVSVLPARDLLELSEALLDFGARPDLEEWLQKHPLPPDPFANSEAGNGVTRES